MGADASISKGEETPNWQKFQIEGHIENAVLIMTAERIKILEIQ